MHMHITGHGLETRRKKSISRNILRTIADSYYTCNAARAVDSLEQIWRIASTEQFTLTRVFLPCFFFLNWLVIRTNLLQCQSPIALKGYFPLADQRFRVPCFDQALTVAYQDH